ncbi:MAG: RNA polymerase sigma factor [Planctomycetota bacterium]|jgi:RNA polymerase sigma-70 factor (ECF subfamily)
MEDSIKARAKRDIEEDRRLARGLLKGKVCAWDEFYGVYAEALYRFLAGRLDSDVEAAAEIAAEAMVLAVEGVRRFDAEQGSLWSWLCGIGMNKIREGRRNAGRPAQLQEQMQEAAVRKGDEGSDVGNIPDVRAALSGLNPRHQEVLILKYVDGQSMKEMAKAMGISEKAVESRLTRGREAFRREYTKLLGSKEAHSDG